MVRTVAVAVAVLAACGGGDDDGLDPVPVVVIDVREDLWASGNVTLFPQVTPLDIVTDLALEVDGVIVDSGPPEAGFEGPSLVWDSRQGADGPHELRVIATTATGRTGADDLGVLIDNTVPVITLVGQSAERTPLDLQFAVVENGSGVRQAVVQWFGGAVPIDQQTWRASFTGCIRENMTAYVSDVAGNTGRIDFLLDAVEECDRDCDDVMAAACGGPDCNDQVSQIPEPTDNFGDALDTNCDGVDGTDADGDGVPGSSAGIAPDCNDSVASIHGYWSNWSISPRIGPQRRDITESSITMRDGRTALLYPVMDGSSTYTALDLHRRDAAGTWSPTMRIAASVSARNVPIVYDTSGHVHAAYTGIDIAQGAGAVFYMTDASGAPVTEQVALGREPRLAIDDAGTVHLLFSRPTDGRMRHARKTATGWDVTILPSAFGPESRGDLFMQNGVLTFVHTDPTGIRIDRYINDAWVLERVNAGTVFAAIPVGNDIVMAAFTGQTQISVFGGPVGPWPGVAFTHPNLFHVSLTAGTDGRIHLVSESLSLWQLGFHAVYANGIWYQEPTISMSRIATDAQGKASAIANAFLIPEAEGAHLLTEGTPHMPATDTAGDGVDQDCDGTDG